MPKNSTLSQAKVAKNDEFYTQYADIQTELNAYIEYNPDVFRGKTILLPCDDPEWSNFTKFFAQNFERYGLKKLISTSYAIESKKYKINPEPTLFETQSPQFDVDKSKTHGKIFVLERGDGNNRGADGSSAINQPQASRLRPRLDINDLQWTYLEGDGDFRSKEVTALRDEADIIITNPPFSLFREFLAWIMATPGAQASSLADIGDYNVASKDARAPGKQFLIIGNMNAITYKEVFPLIKGNNLWIGPSITSGDREFRVPLEYPLAAAGWRIDDDGRHFIRVKGVHWFTNLDHGKRHQPLQLMTMEDNIMFSRHKEIQGIGYQHYDNYDAIEVPYTDAIPSDYNGIMGVPISFLDKYCPEQFEIIGTDSPYFIEELGIGRMGEKWIKDYKEYGGTGHLTANMHSLCLYDGEGKPLSVYKRILIRRKK